MTALYLIPIVAIIIAATSGALTASAIPNHHHQLWTLIISYVFWGIGAPMSWIILTLYFLRLTVHKPLQREVIVSLLLPIGPLGLAGFSWVTPQRTDLHKDADASRIMTLGKLAKKLFPLEHAVPHVKTHAGDVFYIVGLLAGIILWGFAVAWFIIAVMMLVVAKRFPFNMGWWGSIFPIGELSFRTQGLIQRLMTACRRFHTSYNDHRRGPGIKILQDPCLRKCQLL